MNIRSFSILFMTVFLTLLLTACGKDKAGDKRHFIIDTDAGADDACAIIYAAKDKDIVIEGVTVLAGNVDLDQAADNALMALEIAGSDAKVYKGASERYNGDRINAFSVFGSDGMGDVNLIHPSGTAEYGDAVDFILNTVKNNPGEIEIMAIGPATNIARAIEKDPLTMKKVKMIWSMGSTGLGPGNATPVAEFNVYSDTDAYKIMLDSGINITIAGLDMCGGDAMWSDKDFDKLGNMNDTGSFITASFGKIREFYRNNGSESVMNCDPLLALCALKDGFMKESIPCHGSCINIPGENYGEVIFYQKGFTYDVVTNDYVYNVSLVSDVDKDKYFSEFCRAIK